MKLVTIDFETYFDREYSLSKMTTEAYIRDPRFEVIGVGVKVENHPTDWYSGGDVGRFLQSLDYSQRAILCHNTAFDGAILAWRYGIRPRFWLDTLSMARAVCGPAVGGSLGKLAEYYGLGVKGTDTQKAIGKRRADFTTQELARYGEYCVNDVELTYALWKRLKAGFPVSELLVIDQVLRMYTEPCVGIDVPLLQAHLAEIQKRKAAHMGSLGIAVGDLMSNAKFAQVLQQLGVDPPTKTSPATGNTAWAFAKTDPGMLELLEHSNFRVQVVTAARMGVRSTLEETRTQRLLEAAARGPLPVMLKYYAAHTGRLGGGDGLNLQNLPSRGGNNVIRRALLAPPGHVFIACDLSQIEARILAWLAGQEDLLQAFADRRDVYCEFASEVYGRTITKADATERAVGKACTLGLGYGMGAEKFQRVLEIGQAGVTVKLDMGEVERIVRIYRQKNWKIPQLWRRCDAALLTMTRGGWGDLCSSVSYDGTGIKLPNGLYIRYPELRTTVAGFEYQGRREFVKIYGPKMVENCVQALAALLIREQMVDIGVKFRVVLQVHDEIVVAVPKDQAEGARAWIEQCMVTPPTWASGLPVACESGVAVNYGDT